MKWLKIIGWVLKYGTFVSSFGFIITVSIQVFSRYILENVPVWTEEASRILFIYSIAFASGLAYKGNYFVKLDLYHKKKFPQFEITLKDLKNQHLRQVTVRWRCLLMVGLFAQV